MCIADASGQIGRLDLLTSLLAVVTLGLFLAAFPLVSYLRHRATLVALDVSKKAAERMERQVQESVNRMVPPLVHDAVRFEVRAVDEDQADDIASAQDPNGGGRRS